MENAIQVRNLTKKYKDFTLDNISFELPCGMVLGLIGEKWSRKIHADQRNAWYCGFGI